jgi:hypothetical protein
MVLSTEKRKTLSDGFSSVDRVGKQAISLDQLPDLFTAIGLDGDLTGDLGALVIEGIYCGGQVPITFARCETFYTIWKSNDPLGLLKICFRGLAPFEGEQTVNMGQLSQLANVLATNQTRNQLGAAAGGEAAFTFPRAAEILLGLHLPPEASAYDGVREKSSCIIL